MKNALRKENVAAAQRTLPWCAAAFAVTVICAGAVLMINGIYPFGGDSILLGDLSCEYLPFLTELWDKVHSGGSLAYSWGTALGGNFIGNILYYLASPFNLIALLFGRAQIINVIEALIFFRQALAAFTMTWFLSKHRDLRPGAGTAACGICYAFCGWFAAYYFNIIWLDAFWLLPLLLRGVERIIDGYRPWLFAAVLTVMLFSDFYITYIAGVFACLYWLWYFFSGYTVTESRREGKTAVRTPFLKTRFFRAGCLFAVTSVFCILWLGFVFVPLFSLMSHNVENADMPSCAAFFSRFSAQLAGALSGSLSVYEMRLTDNPHIYAGILPLAAAPLYFFIRKVSVREKLLSAGMILFFWLSFNLKGLDYLWHGFRFPNGFPFRQSFMYAFFLLLLACRALRALPELPKAAWAASAGAFGLLLLAGAIARARYGGESLVTPAALGVSAALFALFLAVLIARASAGKKAAALLCAALPLLAAADGIWSFAQNTRLQKTDTATYESVYASMEKLTAETADAPFFRSELPVTWTIDDGSYFGFYGVRQSSSMTWGETLKFMNDLGLDTNFSNFVEYYPQTPVLNSIFGVRYLYEFTDWAAFSHTALADRRGEALTLIDADENFNMFEYGYALPLGFAADRALADWQPKENAAVDNQNDFYALAAGCGGAALQYCDEGAEVTVPVPEATVDEIAPHVYEFRLPSGYTDEYLPVLSCAFTAPRDGTVYVYADMECEDHPYVYCVCEKPEGEAHQVNTSGTTYLSSVYDAKAGDVIRFRVNSKTGAQGTVTVRAFMVDTDALQMQYEAITAAGTLEVESFSDARVTGTATVNADGKILCTSIPYDDGWTVTVDGRTLDDAEVYRVGGCLIGFDLSKGTHAVEFRYALPGLRAGIAVSAVSVAVAVAIVLLFKKRLFGDNT